MSNYRYENKFIIDYGKAVRLKKQLSGIMKLDSHSLNDEVSYYIRSLYFDNIDDDAYSEKVDGVEFRKKYRLRMYNFDSKSIKMECKYKDERMTRKEDCKVGKTTAQKIIDGKYYDVTTKNEFLQRFLLDAKLNYLKPAVIVDYARLAYVYPYSDTRITFDFQLKSLAKVESFFSQEEARVDCFEPNQVVLEVKYNQQLPDHIQSILNQYNLTLTAISKFATCSEYK